MNAAMTLDDQHFAACNTCDRLTEADHRIANHLAMLSGYARLKSRAMVRQGKGLTARDALLLINAVDVQINAVADLHRMLAGHGSRGPMDLPAYLGSVCTALQSVGGDDLTIRRAFLPGCALSSDHLLPVTQIVTEVMTNAIKHARDSAGKVALLVSCRPLADAMIEVSVRDYGPGLAPNSAPKAGQGLGLRIVERLLAQVGGTAAYLSDPAGLTVRLTIPAQRQTA